MCVAPDLCVEEGATITIICTRFQDTFLQSQINYETSDGTATGMYTKCLLSHCSDYYVKLLSFSFSTG